MVGAYIGFGTGGHTSIKFHNGSITQSYLPKELKEALYREEEPRKTISFYQYFHIIDTKQFRDELYERLHQLKVFGRIYIAHEGINAQISVPDSKFERFAVLFAIY
jgi:UPF0176 protein